MDEFEVVIRSVRYLRAIIQKEGDIDKDIIKNSGWLNGKEGNYAID